MGRSVSAARILAKLVLMTTLPGSYKMAAGSAMPLQFRAAARLAESMKSLHADFGRINGLLAELVTDHELIDPAPKICDLAVIPTEQDDFFVSDDVPERNIAIDLWIAFVVAWWCLFAFDQYLRHQKIGDLMLAGLAIVTSALGAVERLRRFLDGR